MFNRWLLLPAKFLFLPSGLAFPFFDQSDSYSDAKKPTPSHREFTFCSASLDISVLKNRPDSKEPESKFPMYNSKSKSRTFKMSPWHNTLLATMLHKITFWVILNFEKRLLNLSMIRTGYIEISSINCWILVLFTLIHTFFTFFPSDVLIFWSGEIAIFQRK